MSEQSDPALPQDLAPVAIERIGDHAIMIRWSDGSECEWSVEKLRKVCPCASCREKKRGALKQDNGENQQETGAKPAMMLPVLSAAEARPLRVESMRPVGSYAYSITFSDGHSSGIYPMSLLYDIESAD